MSDTQQRYEEARRLHEAGRLSDAHGLYMEVIKSQPDHADALHMLGVLEYSAGHYEAAAELISQAVGIDPQNGQYHNNLGMAYRAVDRLDDAIKCYRRGLDIDADGFETEYNLANALAADDELLDAVAHYEHVLVRAPEHGGARNNLALALKALGRLQEAQEQLSVLTKAEPKNSIAFCNLGVVLMELGYVPDAIDSYHQALSISPDLTDAQNNLGVAFLELGREDEAEACFRSALSSDNSTAEIHANLGNVLRKQGKVTEARECYRQAQSLLPNDGVEIRIATLLPVIAASADEIAGARQELQHAVGELLERDLAVKDPLLEVGMTNFHLSYHDENNRDLQRMLAQLFLKASPALAFTAPHCDRGIVGGRQLKIGFVSRYMRTHAVGWCFHGILRFIGREGLHVTAFGFPQRPDPIWDSIARDTDAQVMLPATLQGARDRIAEEQLDILVYTDLGMDPLTYFLAFSRLAPLQVALAGHPDTVGIPSIDYYVSCDDQEPPDAAQHYSERLVRLAGAPTYYSRPAVPTPLRPRRDFELPDDVNLYFCAQTLFKVHPDMDELFARILDADSNGLLVLPSGFHGRWANLLAARFAHSLGGLAKRVRFLPAMTADDFMNVMALADVSLDTRPFGGGNTSWQSIAAGTPAVTWPGEFLRGRYTQALYQRIGVDECTVDNADDYVSTAVRFATDDTFRHDVNARIAARSDELFEDMTVVDALAEFLADVAAR